MQTLEFPEQGFIQGGELAKRILLPSRKKTIHENPSRLFIDTTYIDLARFLPKLLDGTKNNQ